MATTTELPPGPIRTCVGCRRRKAATELVRIVRLGDGTLRVGRTLPGRGAWLCQASPDCLDEAIGKGALARAFRARVDGSAAEALRPLLTDQ